MDFNAALLTEPRFVTGTVSAAAVEKLATGEATRASRSGHACTGIALAAAPKAKAYGHTPAADNVALQVMGVAAVDAANTVQQAYATNDATFGFAQGFDVNALGTTLGEHRTLLHPIYHYPHRNVTRDLHLFYDNTLEWKHKVKYHPDDVSSLFLNQTPDKTTWQNACAGTAPDADDITGGDGAEKPFAKLGVFVRKDAPAVPSKRIRKVENCNAYSTDSDNVDINEIWGADVGFTFRASDGKIKYALQAMSEEIGASTSLVHGAKLFQVPAHVYNPTKHNGANLSQSDDAYEPKADIPLIARKMAQGWRFYHSVFGTPVYITAYPPKCIKIAAD